MGFFRNFEQRVKQVDSILCVGLDPHRDDLSIASAQAACDFCLRLIELTAHVAAAFKPNIAFFEAFGPQGLEALKKVIEEIPDEIPVILDAKRGDIASTARAYAHAVFQFYEANAVTINPYLGYDAVSPFIEDPLKGVFLLCKTSNPGSSDLQDLKVAGTVEQDAVLGGICVYESLASLAQGWNQKDNLGLVVGATHPDALSRVRIQAPDLWILAPGVGAQGGDLQAALHAGLREDGMGMIVPVSRAISRADHPGHRAMQLRDEINSQRSLVLSKRKKASLTEPIFNRDQASLADGLLNAGCVKFGDFTLKSGLQSPIYLDLRLLVGNPDLLRKVANAYLALLEQMSFVRLAALPYAALPIGTAISLQGGLPMIYPRKEVKGYGTRSAVEGPFDAGERVVIIDDLATTGGSKFEAIEHLQAVCLEVEDIVVLIDRQSGAAQALADKGYKLHALFTLTQLLDYWEQKGRVPSVQIQKVRQFLSETVK